MIPQWEAPDPPAPLFSPRVPGNMELVYLQRMQKSKSSRAFVPDLGQIIDGEKGGESNRGLRLHGNMGQGKATKIPGLPGSVSRQIPRTPTTSCREPGFASVACRMGIQRSSCTCGWTSLNEPLGFHFKPSHTVRHREKCQKQDRSTCCEMRSNAFVRTRYFVEPHP